jgi:hypothetical protein
MSYRHRSQVNSIGFSPLLAALVDRQPSSWSSAEQKLAYVYFEDEPGRCPAAHLLTREEARRIAAWPTYYPDLPQQLRQLAHVYGDASGLVIDLSVHLLIPVAISPRPGKRWLGEWNGWVGLCKS